MEHLIKYKGITDAKEINTVEKFVHVKITPFGEFIQYTYSIATTKKGPTRFEDHIFSNYPILVKYVPRGFSIVTKDSQIVSILEGPVKFSGITMVDEDPDDGAEEEDTYKTKSSEHEQLVSWATDSNLEIVETEKANGKFAIFRIVNFEGKYYYHVGSKNKHLFFLCESIDSHIISVTTGKIISSILSDIKTNQSVLFDPKLLEFFESGYSLCGELCDGEHFMVGDNLVHWFGLFKCGYSMDTTKCFNFISGIGLKTVPSSIVYDSESKVENLDKVFLASRCKMTEGSVLRCKNTLSGQIILIKTKSVSYITKRFMRQSILKGYNHMIDSVTKRFVDAQEYHGLNTNASIRMCCQLIRFGFWLMNKEYPVAVLDVKQINAIRGMLDNGFSKYWQMFLSETGESEQMFVLEDFGSFDKKVFLSNVQPYENRTKLNPALVVFFQGLQGSGKSTIAQNIQSMLKEKGTEVSIVEQDRFYGCTVSTQGYLYHCIRNVSAPNIILISRCNVSPVQYSRYLEMCKKLPTKVIFVSPASVDELYLSVCISGIFNRSASGDNLLIGRKEYSVEESTKFIVQNYRDFVVSDSSFKIGFHATNDKLLSDAKSHLLACKVDDYKPLTNWIQENLKKLHDLRYSVDAISDQIIRIIYSQM